MSPPEPANRPDPAAPTGGTEPQPDNRQVLRWRRPAGLIVLLVLVGLCVMSLFRTPNPIWTWVSAALAVALAGLLIWDAKHRTAGGARR
jgi:hypothetical protein